ncbi:hypothetical protein BH11PSE8_BH11PSE8_33490 [soil metagenome]
MVEGAVGRDSDASLQPSDSARLAKLNFMRVSELARQTGVSAHRLRHYEELGLIHAERSGAGYRHFAERTARDVVFIAMSRDLGFSLKQIAETLPRYRAGNLSFDELVEIMRRRIAEVDEQIAAQRAVRKKLVSHIAWLEKRKREFAKRSLDKTPTSWPATRKASR